VFFSVFFRGGGERDGSDRWSRPLRRLSHTLSRSLSLFSSLPHTPPHNPSPSMALSVSVARPVVTVTSRRAIVRASAVSFGEEGGTGRHSPPPLLFLSFFCCVLSALAPHPDPPRPRPRSQRTLHPTQAPRDAAPIVISRRAATLAAAAALLAATPRPAAAFLGLGGASRDEEYAKDTVRMWGWLGAETVYALTGHT